MIPPSMLPTKQFVVIEHVCRAQFPNTLRVTGGFILTLVINTNSELRTKHPIKTQSMLYLSGIMKESTDQHRAQFEWAVIGAGPAGIATIGRLLDAGVDGKSIAWIDPHFTVGDFGAKWHSVSSNTRVGLFEKFLNECKSFHYDKCPMKFALHEMDPLKTCELSCMVAPLKWVTDQLRGQVVCIQEHASALNSHKSLAHARAWDVALESSLITSHNVVLALGSQPKSLNLPGVQEVSVTDALNAQRISQCFLPSDTVAVFGASHSAILIIRLLLERCAVKRVVNFYRNPIRYAEYLDGWIRHDDTGLKGTTAQWSRDNIDVNCPEKLYAAHNKRGRPNGFAIQPTEWCDCAWFVWHWNCVSRGARQPRWRGGTPRGAVEIYGIFRPSCAAVACAKSLTHYFEIKSNFFLS